MTEVTLKAYDGDRAENLRGIAEWMDESAACLLPVTVEHKCHGYAEQLRIIAKEVKQKDEALRYLKADIRGLDWDGMTTEEADKWIESLEVIKEALGG